MMKILALLKLKWVKNH